MIWLLVSASLAAPTLTITGSCPGTVRIAADNGDANTQFGLVTGRANGSLTLPAATPCPGTTVPVSNNVSLRGMLDADASGEAVLLVDLASQACSAYAAAVDTSACEATDAVDMSAICADADLDGVCDGDDLCEGDDAAGDLDLDGLCDDTDVCWGLDSTGDDDADGTCNDADV
jgi:hypothetical protein